MARAEAAKGRSDSTAFGVPGGDKPLRCAAAVARASMPRRERRTACSSRGAPASSQAVARQQIAEPVAYIEEPQVGSRHVGGARGGVEPEPQPADPQGAIDRAIATLDREARGEAMPHGQRRGRTTTTTIDARQRQGQGPASAACCRTRNADPLASCAAARAGQAALPPPRASGAAPSAAARPRRDRESVFAEAASRVPVPSTSAAALSAVTIFLIVFVVLLAGARWRRLLGVARGLHRSRRDVRRQATAVVARPTADCDSRPTADVAADAGIPAPGNTATAAERSGACHGTRDRHERLPPDPALTGTEPLALAATCADRRGADRAERLPGADSAADAAAAGAATVDPADVAGSQSLLLEASDDGTTGAVPFSGTVEWSKGDDETGLPTLIGKAKIPARNLGVDVLIRKNSDPSLPASHLMEINFRVTDSFIGGSVAGLPGVLLKNEELVQGTPLVGASARVVGNSFLFALSASPRTTPPTTTLLTSASGWTWRSSTRPASGRSSRSKRTTAAEALFTEVFAAWGDATDYGCHRHAGALPSAIR